MSNVPQGAESPLLQKNQKSELNHINQINMNRPSLMEACQNTENTEILFFLHPHAKSRDKSYSTNSNNLLLNKKHGYIHLLWSKKKKKKPALALHCPYIGFMISSYYTLRFYIPVFLKKSIISR